MTTSPITLSKLLGGLADVEQDVPVNNLCLDHRQVQQGDVFVAIQGATHDGHQYIQGALENGAVAIICEKKFTESTNVPVITISDLVAHLPLLAQRCYPLDNLTIVGVTGTNGKTSITYMLSAALSAAGKRCGVIGTLGSGFVPHLDASRLTTPDILSVYRRLFDLKKGGAEYVAMEVSSHGLDQHRVEGVPISIAVFTNLSRDHLDYHHDMKQYGSAKKQLFQLPSVQTAIINIDDEFGVELAKEFDEQLNVFPYAIKSPTLNCKNQTVVANKIKLHAKGSQAEVITPWGSGTLRLKLLGEFNISNVLAVVIAMQQCGVAVEHSLKLLANLTPIPGRMQTFGGGKQALVVVDYSHTPDALQQALETLRSHTSGKLWCVFGCGGDRDQGKRAQMGQVAERFSDQVIITNDNPRTEPPEVIVDAIKEGLICPWAVEVELDRGAAIAHAIDCADPGDVVLIAGKGHEPYQIIGAEKLPFSDIQQVKTFTQRKTVQS